MKKKILEAGLKIDVKHSSIDQIPVNADVVFTLEKLAERALKAAPGARIIAVKNLLDNTIYDEYVGSLKKLQ